MTDEEVYSEFAKLNRKIDMLIEAAGLLQQIDEAAMSKQDRIEGLKKVLKNQRVRKALRLVNTQE